VAAEAAFPKSGLAADIPLQLIVRETLPSRGELTLVGIERVMRDVRDSLALIRRAAEDFVSLVARHARRLEKIDPGKLRKGRGLWLRDILLSPVACRTCQQAG